MTTARREQSAWTRRDTGAVLFLCALTLALAVALALLNRHVEFDRDEGFTLIKAWLLGKGDAMYSQIWSDQPPGMTVLLMLVIKLFGNSLLACRVFVGLLSAILVASFYSLVRQTASTGAALVAALLLFYSPDFVGLTASVMIGLPAMACAVLAAKLLTDYGRTREIKYFFFALLGFCLSLQIKFIPVIYLPGLLIPLLMGPESGFGLKGKTVKPALIWMSLLFLITIGVLLCFAGSEWRQLVGPHIGVKPFGETSPEASRRIALRIVDSFLPLAPLMVLACVEWRRRREPYRLIPVVWVACSLYFLLAHKPIRYHYAPNLAVPAAWLAVMALPDVDVMALLRACVRRGRLPLRELIPGLVALICVPLWAATRLPSMTTPPLLAPPSWSVPIEPEILQLLSDHKLDHEDRLFTDRAMYAFEAKIPMPPSLAVISGKRLNSGYLPGDYFMRKISRKPPRHVILYRLPPERFSPAFPDYLMDNYKLIYRSGQIRYYLKN